VACLGRILPELPNFYCHPGRAGGLPGLLALERSAIRDDFPGQPRPETRLSRITRPRSAATPSRLLVRSQLKLRLASSDLSPTKVLARTIRVQSRPAGCAAPRQRLRNGFVPALVDELSPAGTARASYERRKESTTWTGARDRTEVHARPTRHGQLEGLLGRRSFAAPGTRSPPASSCTASRLRTPGSPGSVIDPARRSWPAHCGLNECCPLNGCGG
jgi:hypothetical protein